MRQTVLTFARTPDNTDRFDSLIAHLANKSVGGRLWSAPPRRPLYAVAGRPC